MSYKVIFCLVLLFTTSLFSQIKGKVISQDDGKAIVGANVVVDGGGTSTNRLGQFSIDIPVGAKIEFSHLGYKTLTQDATKDMIILLKPYPINVDEIVVYSGLNDESLQRLSHSVSVITNNEIKKSSAHHFQTLTHQIPNLTWAGGTSRPRYFQIRGIGERSHYFGEGAPNFSVGFIIDDIDLSGLGMVGHLFDLKQIEIFKGPMSSVFGSNSLAGLISIRSQEPKDYFENSYLFSRGTDNHVLISNAINFKMHENLGIRMSGTYNYSNGFRNNILKEISDSNKREELFSRIKVKYKPSNNINILSTLIYANMANGYDAWAPDNNTNYKTYSDDDGEDSQRTVGGSMRIHMSLSEGMTLTSITSSSKTDLIHSYDGDWANDSYWYEKHEFDPLTEGWSYKFYDNNKKDRKNIAQEFRISINDIILGMFYKDMEELDQAIGYLFGGLGTGANSKFDFEVISSYAQFGLALSSKVKLSTNFRIEKNIMDYFGTTIGVDESWEPVELPTVSFHNDHLMTGYRVSLVFKKSNATRFTSSIAKGYKSGGVNQQPYLQIANRSYEPEALVTTEIGLKHKTNILRSNITYFYGFRRDQQVSISSQQVEGDPNSFIYYTSNAGSGTINGLEMENKFKLSKNFILGLSGAYLDTWIDNYNYYIAHGVKVSAGNRGAAMAPKFSGSMNLTYESSWGLTSYLVTNYKSDYYYSDSHNERSTSYSTTDLSLSKKMNKAMTITFWSRNIFDERYTTRGFYFGLIPPNYTKQLFESYADPRQTGFTIKCQL